MAGVENAEVTKAVNAARSAVESLATDAHLPVSSGAGSTATSKAAPVKLSGAAVPIDPTAMAGDAYNALTAQLKHTLAMCDSAKFSADTAFYKSMVTSLADESPRFKKLGPGARSALDAVAPVVAVLVSVTFILAPLFVSYALLLVAGYRYMQARLPPDLLQLSLGLLLCFFGGDYAALICANEAFALVDGAAALAAAQTVVDEVSAVAAASRQDDAVRAKDGAKKTDDTLHPTAVLRRKTLLFAKLSHPDKLSAAVTQLGSVWLAVSAALRLQFARALALGLSIAASIQPMLEKHVLPSLNAATPPEMAAWNATILAAILKALVLLFGFFAFSLMAAAHSALKGGRMAAEAGLNRLSSMGLLPASIAPKGAHLKYTDEIVHAAAVGLAALGVLFQLSSGFSVPFPLSLFTFPLDIAEWGLVSFVMGSSI